jgi:hypothetical protein
MEREGERPTAQSELIKHHAVNILEQAVHILQSEYKNEHRHVKYITSKLEGAVQYI